MRCGLPCDGMGVAQDAELLEDGDGPPQSVKRILVVFYGDEGAYDWVIPRQLLRWDEGVQKKLHQKKSSSLQSAYEAAVADANI